MQLIGLAEAAILIRQECEQNRNPARLPFFFIVGAGISNPTLPLASEIVEHCRAEAQRYGRSTPVDAERPIDQYSTWFQLAYPAPIARQSYLRELILGKPISEANLRLAHILSTRRVANTVVTPNFDDFLSRALTLFGVPVILCDHPQTTERIDPDAASDLQIVHVHGSYSFYDCCNLSGEVEARARVSGESTSTMGFLLDSILRAHAPIVVGYSGWESDVVMSALRRRLQSALPQNVYWFCYTNTEIDGLPVWLKDHRNVFIVSPGLHHPGLATEFADGEKEERATHLPAKAVFDELIRTFSLESPLLTRDPLAFLADHLRRSLQGGDVEDATDIYGIKSVVERVERAKAYESDSASGTDFRRQAEHMRESIRQSAYDEAVAIAASMKIEQLDEAELLELLDLLGTATSSDWFEVPSLPYDIINRVNATLRELGVIDSNEWARRTAETLLRKAEQVGTDDEPAAIAICDEIVTRFDEYHDSQLQLTVARALAKKAELLWQRSSPEVVAVCDLVVTRYGEQDRFLQPVAHALVTSAAWFAEQELHDRALDATAEFFRRVAERSSEEPFTILVERVTMVRARSLDALGRYAEAIVLLSDLIPELQRRNRPSAAYRAMALKASVQAHAGHLDDALSTLDTSIQALELAKRSVATICKAVIAKAEFAESVGRFGDAAQTYNFLINRFGASKSRFVRNYAQVAAEALEKLAAQSGTSTTTPIGTG